MRKNTVDRADVVIAILAMCILIVAVLGVVYLAVHTSNKYEERAAAKAKQPKEFVCETEGILTERHVGVGVAELYAHGMWRLRYVDGDGAPRYYLQKPGETCALEAY